MLSQEILDLYKKSRLMTYRAMFGRIREKTGSLSATEAYAVDVIYLLGSPTITQLAETLGISQPNATYKVNNLVAKGTPAKRSRRTTSASAASRSASGFISTTATPRALSTTPWTRSGRIIPKTS